MRKFSSIVVFLFLYFSFNLGGHEKPAFAVNIPPESLPNFYKTLFQNPYEYMFSKESSNQGLSINGHSLGSYMGGIRGFLFYWSFIDCVEKFQNLKKNERDFYDLTPIETLSGVKIFLKQSSNEKEFSLYNPEIVVWGRENLIPQPKDQVYGYSFGELYLRIFKRFFRLLTESYLFVHQEKTLENEQLAYLKKMVEKDFEALSYLEDRFKNNLAAYSTPADGTNFTPPMAIGFWIRRSIDKTDQELWLALKKLMMLYDHRWLNEIEAYHLN